MKLGVTTARSAVRHITRCGVSALLLACGACHRGDQEPNTQMSNPPLVQTDANAKPVEVEFPLDKRQADKTLNEFIEDVLDTCAKGDYDGFRQFFSAAYNPPNKSEFDKVWYQVKSVKVFSVHVDDRQQPPTYYVHAVVELRKGDSHQRTRRDAVVAVFRETGEWRLAAPPREIERMILVADSQPAAESQPSAAGKTAIRRPENAPVAESRPSATPGV